MIKRVQTHTHGGRERECACVYIRETERETERKCIRGREIEQKNTKRRKEKSVCLRQKERCVDVRKTERKCKKDGEIDR